MNTLKVLQNNIYYLIGPLAAAATLFALLLKGSTMQITPFIALFGIGLCWKWHLKGLIAAFLLIAISISFEFASMNPSEILWNTGAAFSFALSLMIVTLSNSSRQFQQDRVKTPVEEKITSIDSFELNVKESLPIDLPSERHAELKLQLTTLEKDLKIHFEHAAANQTIIETLQVALKTSQMQQQQSSEEHSQLSKTITNTLSELSNYKVKASSLQLELNTSLDAYQQLTKQQQLSAEHLNKENNLREAAEQKYRDLLSQQANYAQLQIEKEQLSKEKLNLSNQIKIYESENQTKKNELLNNQNHIEKLILQNESTSEENEKLVVQLNQSQQQLQELHKQNEELINTNKLIIEDLELLKRFSQQSNAEIEILKKQVEEATARVLQTETTPIKLIDSNPNDPTTAESNKIDRALRIAKGQVKELRTQFIEKSNELDRTRKSLFHAEEKILLQQLKQSELEISLHPEFIAINQYLKQIEIEFSETEDSYSQEITALNDLITNLMSEKAHSKE